MNVNYEICPKNGEFFARQGDYGYLRFKGTATKDDGVMVFPFIRVMSSVSGLNVARYMGEPLDGEEFDIEIKVPYGSDYHIIIEFRRENDEEWVSCRKIISKIAIGDVFIIAGQSNAVGYGCGYYTNTVDSKIYNFKMSEEWEYASHPLHGLDGYKGEVKRDGNSAYSQHITMAKKIIAHTGVPIAFIPTAVGGTSIHRWNKRYNGDLYTDMIRRVKVSGVKPAGLIWSQGSSDANSDERAEKYYEMLKEFICDTRDELNIPDLKIFIYQINNFETELPENQMENWSLIRDAHCRITTGLKNVYSVSSFGAKMMVDGIHNSPEGCDLIGERMATVVLSKFYGKDISSNSPMAIRATNRNGEVEITFNYETRFVIRNGFYKKPFAFKVKDKNGFIEIKEFRFGTNTVTLTLEREIDGEAYAYGAYGNYPKGEIPCDFNSGIPMQAFKLKITEPYIPWDEGYEKEIIDIDGRKTIIVIPKKPNGKWAIKTEYMPAFPDVQKKLLESGYYITHVTNKTRWHDPGDTDARAKLSEYMVNKYGVSSKCVLIGMSCGGMQAIYFAAKYPELVSCMYLDAPVVNLLSCPFGIGKGLPHGEEFERHKGMNIAELIGYRNHPLDNLDKLVESKIPVFLVNGDSDSLVPYEENGKFLNDLYEKNGLVIETVIKKGGDHHPHGLPDNTPIINFIIKYDK